MKVATNQIKPKAHRPYKLWLSFGLILALLFLSFGSGVYAHRSGELQTVAHDLVNAAQNIAILTRQLKVKPRKISIDISHEGYQKLRYSRDRAISEGFLVTHDDSYVQAKLRFSDQTVKVQLRLKGDEIRHVTSNKWSFRVKTQGNDTFMGMRKFSLHAAHERAYVAEWLFHHMAQRDDLLGLRYEFADITLNGEHLGIYAIEEHFEKRLIEHNRRREGPILSFDEDYWWDEQHALYTNNLKHMWTFDWFRLRPDYSGYHALRMTPFQSKRTYTNESLHAQYKIARALLARFRDGQLQSSQVFDVNRVARYLALCDLFGGSHSFHTNQLRFYYNPVISKLELIPYDPGLGENPRKLTMPLNTLPGHVKRVNRLFTKQFDTRWGYNQAYFLGQLFEDWTFYEAYNRELYRLSNKTYLDEMLAHFQEQLHRQTQIIQTEYTNYHFSTDELYANARYIQMLLHPNKAMHAFLSESDGHQIHIEVGALQIMPVQVVGLSFQGKLIATTTDNVILTPKNYRDTITYQTIKFDLPSSFDLSNDALSHVSVTYRILGVDSTHNQPLFLESRMGDSLVAQDIIRKPSNIDEFSFLHLDSANKRIHIKPGNWSIDHNLIIPAGYTVTGRPGTRLNLINQANILSHSSLHLEGNPEHPFIIESTDQTGQGVLVLSSAISTLRHVQFRGLTNPTSGDWSVTSAVTFYETDVTLSHCLFIANRCEDALNVIRATFNLDSCRFENTLSDAFDSDFSKGSITNCEFVDSGNDAIDVSGTVLKVEDVRIYEAADKGISSGENSRVLARHIVIRNSNIGIASKDLSNVTLDQSSISGCNYGFAVYQKKSEFGPATIHVTNTTLHNIAKSNLVEEDSILYIDDTQINGKHKNVYQSLASQIY